jgi:hypothetical protein
MRMRTISAANAEADARTFIDGAELAFGRWGGQAMFDWALRRAVAGRSADLLLLDDAGQTIAGSAIAYRRMLHTDGREQLAAIMTASWTSPEARGRGAFARMIKASLELASESEAILLGFGREENASYRRFVAAGATLHPTFYCRSLSAGQEEGSLQPLEPDGRLFRMDGTHFKYTAQEWLDQFVRRPGAPVECLGRPGEWSAIIQRTDEFDQVHALSDRRALPALAARAQRAGRRLFHYTTSNEEARDLAGAGYEWTAGFLSVLPGSDIEEWSFQNGDRS